MNESTVPLIIVAAIVFVPLIWFIATFNVLVRRRNSCDESWSGIDTELKRRYDLIPNLVKTVQAYAAHERDVLERVIAARSAAMANEGSPKAQARDENALVGGLRQMFALTENYPQLKANRHFLELQTELANTEDRIARARRFYNANVRDFNNKVEMVPSNFVASMFSFRSREPFEIDDLKVRQAPAVAVP